MRSNGDISHFISAKEIKVGENGGSGALIRQNLGWKKWGADTTIQYNVIQEFINLILLATIAFGSVTEPQGCCCSQCEQQPTSYHYNGKGNQSEGKGSYLI